MKMTDTTREQKQLYEGTTNMRERKPFSQLNSSSSSINKNCDPTNGNWQDSFNKLTRSDSSATKQHHKLTQRFSVIRRLGKGTYGKVQLAINKLTNQEVAIKTIRKSRIESEADLQRVRREIAIMSSIEHPHIVHIYEVFENKDKIVLVMQYASGGELYEYVSKKRRVEERDARRLFRQIAAAIYYCHSNNICHRDLKLENILLDERNNAKIADFGLSNIFNNNSLNNLRTFCGSPLYASPEIVLGIPYNGPEVDCWSLGVLLYTLVYGAMPFDGTNHKTLVSQISTANYFEPRDELSGASRLIRKLLCANSSKRATIVDVCNDSWVNMTPNLLPLLSVAQDMANLAPVRQDLLDALKNQQQEQIDKKAMPCYSPVEQIATDSSTIATTTITSKPPTTATTTTNTATELLTNDEQQDKYNDINIEEDMTNTQEELMKVDEMIVDSSLDKMFDSKETYSDPSIKSSELPCFGTEIQQFQDTESQCKVCEEKEEVANHDMDCSSSGLLPNVNVIEKQQEFNKDANDNKQYEDNNEIKNQDVKKNDEKEKKKKVIRKKIIVKKIKKKNKFNEDDINDQTTTTMTDDYRTDITCERPASVACIESTSERKKSIIDDNLEFESTKSDDTFARTTKTNNNKINNNPLLLNNRRKSSVVGKLKIPTTFLMTKNEQQQQQQSTNDLLDNNNQDFSLDKRRYSVEKSSLIIEVSNKIIQQQQQQHELNSSKNSSINVGFVPAKVSITKDEFERRSSLINAQEELKQNIISARRQSKIASINANNVEDKAIKEREKNESIQRELAKYVESLEKLRDAAEQVDDTSSNNNDNIGSTTTGDSQNKQNLFTSRVTIRLSESSNKMLSVDDDEIVPADDNYDEFKARHSNSNAMLPPVPRRQQPLQPQPQQKQLNQIMNPVPITRSYKKVTFTKDGASITETGRISTCQAADGSIQRIERKSKVTHYPSSPSSSSSSVKLFFDKDNSHQQQQQIPIISPEDNDNLTQQSSSISLLRRKSSKSKQTDSSTNNYCPGKLLPLSLCDSRDSNASSTSSLDIFDDIFDTWTGAANMFASQQKAMMLDERNNDVFAKQTRPMSSLANNNSSKPPFCSQLSVSSGNNASIFATLSRRSVNKRNQSHKNNQQPTNANTSQDHHRLLRRGESLEPKSTQRLANLTVIQSKLHDSFDESCKSDTFLKDNFFNGKSNKPNSDENDDNTIEARRHKLLESKHFVDDKNKKLSTFERNADNDNELADNLSKRLTLVVESEKTIADNDEFWNYCATPNLSSSDLFGTRERLFISPQHKATVENNLTKDSMDTNLLNSKLNLKTQTRRMNESQQQQQQQQVRRLSDERVSDWLIDSANVQCSSLSSKLSTSSSGFTDLPASASFITTATGQQVPNFKMPLDCKLISSSTGSQTAPIQGLHSSKKVESMLDSKYISTSPSMRDNFEVERCLTNETDIATEANDSPSGSCNELLASSPLLEQLKSRGYKTLISQRLKNPYQDLLENKVTTTTTTTTTVTTTLSTASLGVDLNKSQQQTLPGYLDIDDQTGNDEQKKETTTLQTESKIDEFEKTDKGTEVEETKQINSEKSQETLVDDKSIEETNEISSLNEVDDKKDDNEDGEDDDVAEARKQIKCHLERMRQTEEFLKSVNSEQQINSERQRLSQLKLCFDTLMSTSLVNKQQSMTTTTSRLFGSNNEVSDSIYSSSAPIDCNSNRSKGLLDNMTSDFNLNNQQLQRQQVNFMTNFNRDSSYQSPPSRRRFMSVERDFGIEPNYSISAINQSSFDQSPMNNCLLSSNQYQKKSFDFDTMRSSRCSEIQNEVSTWRASRLRSRSQMNERFSATNTSGGYNSRHLSSSTVDDLDYQQANNRSRYRSVSQNRHDYSGFNTTPSLSYKTSLGVASQSVSSSKQTLNDIKNDNSDNEFDAEMESYRPPAYEPTIVTNRKRFPSNQTIANDKTEELRIVDDIKKANNNNNDKTSTHANSKLSQLEARILERRKRTADLLSSSSSSAHSSSQYQKRNLSVDRMTTKITPVNNVKEYESKAGDLFDKQFCHGNTTSNNDDEQDDNNNIESMESRIRRKSYCVKLSKDSSNNNLSSPTTRKMSLEKWREKRRSSLTISNSSSISIAPNNTITTNNNIGKQLN